MSQTLDSIFIRELEGLHQKNLIRKLMSWEGQGLLFFCANDYLGLSRHPRIIRRTTQAIETYGVGAGASRLISGTTEAHRGLEKELAQFKRKDSALIFGSGFLTNLGVLSALASQDDLIVTDKLSHASLIDGARLSGATLRVFPHRDYKRCEEILKKCKVEGGKERAYGRILLVSDAVFSMDGDLADLDELIRLKEKYDCLLVIDDAHGIGVYGARGRGATEGREEKIDLIVGTLSKSLGVLGGFVAASQLLIDHLINFSRPFIFATALPSHLACAALESLHLIQEDPSFRQTLWRNVDQVLEFLNRIGIKAENRSPIIPLIVGEEKKALRISEELLKKGILIPAIRYPTVQKGKARLRLTISASHNQKDLERLFQALECVWNRNE